jgi:hypothetical protein
LGTPDQGHVHMCKYMTIHIIMGLFVPVFTHG